MATILGRLHPAPVVKIFELPDLLEHGDIADFVDDNGERITRLEAVKDVLGVWVVVIEGSTVLDDGIEEVLGGASSRG